MTMIRHFISFLVYLPLYSVAGFSPLTRSGGGGVPLHQSGSRSSSVGVGGPLSAGPRTLYDKIWDDHLVDDDGLSSLLYVDRHLVHEVTSPQAFEGLRIAGRGARRPDCTLVTVDHNVPTSDRAELVDVATFIEEAASRTQVQQLDKNVQDFGLKYFDLADERQGVVHIVGPEQGFTLPGMRHSLRRQSYSHPRCVRCARIRYRDQRGGTRPCNTGTSDEEGKRAT